MPTAPLHPSPGPAGRAARRKGFTLLEVMIALAILAGALVAIAGINSAAVSMHVYSKKLTVATLLARSKMADLETQLMSEDLPADDAEEEGTFEEEGFPAYRWRAEIVRPKTEDVTPAELLALAGLDSANPAGALSGGAGDPSSLLGGLAGKVPGLGAGLGSAQGTPGLAAAAAGGGAGLLGGAMTSQVQTMLDMLGKSVREVRLTVAWGEGSDADQFTVATHVVSFGRGTDKANSDPASQAALSGEDAAALGRNLSRLPGGALPGGIGPGRGRGPGFGPGSVRNPFNRLAPRGQR